MLGVRTERVVKCPGSVGGLLRLGGMAADVGIVGIVAALEEIVVEYSAD